VVRVTRFFKYQRRNNEPVDNSIDLFIFSLHPSLSYVRGKYASQETRGVLLCMTKIEARCLWIHFISVIASFKGSKNRFISAEGNWLDDDSQSYDFGVSMSLHAH
jgi:hypothetical protein